MSEKTKIWYLQNFNLFQGIDTTSMERMNKMSRMKESKKKDIIYFPDESSNNIYFLKAGKIKISRISEDGRITTMQLLGPGEIFGEGSLLGQDVHENIAEVVEDAVVCSINKDIFQDMMLSNPKLNLSINKFIGFKLRRIEAKIEDLVFKNAKERIIAFLKRYGKNFGKKMVDGVMVRPFLTHQEIADLTATARQTVNTILNDLVTENKIKYSRRHLLIRDKSWKQNK
ncbi:MAG: Crp/Fnr family transcriptional regulator [Candidatus Marinimicrobia bacterium]|jgi:CRP-like cAMP-binding protein|nr:Crp/Fnr family transcriptional regulator [Candidatus Neomarinimicrobiota bacterium]MBT3692659.1 Crp/Fnr family transcriptional regulator [Candidatus Neomarinimicrobiota bacterium]MBT3732838.1 Crp/Fnr family transcriptional regulator [Candidatus Neomarinimicrobiota bacterium]MBT4143971.1 Crp/Fnr family transcriptional regulator [Candidatus Neomarinimicrobiota bacterium]MBT4178085.1 Crp/Fnr family transcriptional regulator [Candidatus Neomarinimicrobiota bacterium]